MVDLAKIDVLVVDDDNFHRQLIYKSLQTVGVRRIRLATSVDHALALINVTAPDLILTDQHMPGGTGIDLARRLLEKQLFDNPEASANKKYGIDATAASGFAGDLDELLGDMPTATPQKKLPKDKPIPIVLVTSRPTRELVEDARSANIAGLLVKPFKPAELATRLKAALRFAGREEEWSID